MTEEHQGSFAQMSQTERVGMTETNHKRGLLIDNLHVSVEGKPIVNGVTLEIQPGEVHAIMGPNGSGKSTLAYSIMGHPKYKITQGAIRLEGEDIKECLPDERARKGLFLAFQYPTTIPGVSVGNFLRASLRSMRGADVPIREFRQQLKERMAQLKILDSFVGRYLNDGFSGGEKKRMEILQMALLSPKIAILDETDSGLDIDALKVVSEGVNHLIGPNVGILLITHYHRILKYIRPHFVHVLMQGRIVKSGKEELAQELEAKGYDWLVKQPLAASA